MLFQMTYVFSMFQLNVPTTIFTFFEQERWREGKKRRGGVLKNLKYRYRKMNELTNVGGVT